MAKSNEPKKITVRKHEPEPLDFEPAPETEMNFMTEEEEKKRKRNIIIGVVIGLLIAALAIWGIITHIQNGQVNGNGVTVISTSRSSTKPGSLEPSNTSTTRTYATAQLTVHKDEKGVWRSYAGLEKTVGYTGVVGNDTGWWMVVNDLVDFTYNGIGKNDHGEWIVENGKVNTKYSGKYVFEDRLYTIKDGQVVYSEKIVATTVAPTTTTTTTTTTATTTTTQHIHDWQPVYEGNAETSMQRSYCMCPECGLKFANRSLLEDHAAGSGHNLSAEASDDVFYADEPTEVITGYTGTYYKCTECGATTDKIE